MDMDSKFGLTAQNMKVNGQTIRQMVKENLFMQMVTSMKASGRMTKPMVMVLTNTLMGPLILVNGKTISSTATVLKHGLTVLSTKASMLRVRNMVKALSLLLIAACILETSSTMKFQEREDITGLMAKLMKDNGIKIRCMDMVS
jgi:predicted nucleic-acid-binding protein